VIAGGLKILVWIFAALVVALGLTLGCNSGTTEELAHYALPRWLYILFAVPSLLLLLVFIGLQPVEKKSLAR
jgi:ABC-type dipeptide/oligopeptide/nickel transport system permease subunit